MRLSLPRSCSRCPTRWRTRKAVWVGSGDRAWEPGPVVAAEQLLAAALHSAALAAVVLHSAAPAVVAVVPHSAAPAAVAAAPHSVVAVPAALSVAARNLGVADTVAI